MNCDTTSDDDGFVDCPICNGTGWLLTANDIAKLHQELDNLHANGVVSTTYPVTKGHDPVHGEIRGQEHFKTPGRVREQWVHFTKLTA